MLNFKIEESKCIKCGQCIEECPMAIIEMLEYPQIKKGREKNCINCQHCLAICPTGALSILNKKPENSISYEKELPKPEEMVRLIKTRRSIRKYKDENVDKDLINKMLETASYAPTGHNDNAVLFTIIDNKEELLKFKELVYNTIKEKAEKNEIRLEYMSLYKIQQVWEKKGIDIIFRNAPHMLISSSPKEINSPEADSIIALSYFELLANTNKLGVLWNGMINWTINFVAPELKEVLNIPENHKIGYVQIFGKPKTKYKRSIQSNGTHINKVTL